MKIVLEGERPKSWNDSYAGQHWSKRKLEADRVHRLVKQRLAGPGRNTGGNILGIPVAITITAYFKNRPLDPDNIFSKVYIDALKGLLIADDDPEHIASVTTRSRTCPANPRIEIEVECAAGGEG